MTKQIINGIKSNPNDIIKTLTHTEVFVSEFGALKLNLKYRLLLRDLIVILVQIAPNNPLKEKRLPNTLFKEHLNSFTYSYLNSDFKMFAPDQKVFPLSVSSRRNLRS